MTEYRSISTDGNSTSREGACGASDFFLGFFFVKTFGEPDLVAVLGASGVGPRDLTVAFLENIAFPKSFIFHPPPVFGSSPTSASYAFVTEADRISSCGTPKGVDGSWNTGEFGPFASEGKVEVPVSPSVKVPVGLPRATPIPLYS